MKRIDEEKPRSIKELAELSGRQVSNLSRTLKIFNKYGMVDIIENEAPPQQATGYQSGIRRSLTRLRSMSFGGSPCHSSLQQVADAPKPLRRRCAAGYSGEGE